MNYQENLKLLQARPAQINPDRHIIAIGGNASDRCYDAVAKAAKGKIIIITAASSTYQAELETYKFTAEQFKLQKIPTQHLSTKDFKSGKALEILDGAYGVYFSGGDQKKLIEYLLTYLDVYELILLLALIAGTSAGASAIGQLAPQEEDIIPALNLQNRVIVDQHVDKRKRFGRVLRSAVLNPGFVSLGIFESAAISFTQSFVTVHTGKVYAVKAEDNGYINLEVFKAGDVFEMNRYIH